MIHELSHYTTPTNGNDTVHCKCGWKETSYSPMKLSLALSKHLYESTTYQTLVTDKAVYHPWTDGTRVGFAIHRANHPVEYLYLNPSTDYETPDVFIYKGFTTIPDQDMLVCWVAVGDHASVP